MEAPRSRPVDFHYLMFIYSMYLDPPKDRNKDCSEQLFPI